MNRIMIYAFIVALVLILFGFNNVASTLLNVILSVIKWIFIIGVIAFVIFVIFGRKK